MDHVDDLLRQTQAARSLAESRGNTRTASALAGIAAMIAAIGQGEHVPGATAADAGAGPVHVS